ncbi:MAG: hypothetical protein AAGD07_18835 [Planctomycetota bacterium]
MADKAKVEVDQQAKPPTTPGRRVMLAGVGVVTLTSLLGFATMFSIWLGGGDIDSKRILRLASSQYVAGNRIVAADLAKQAMLSAGGSDSETEDEAPLEDSEPEAEQEKPNDEQEWQSLKDFLIGAGQSARADLAGSARERRDALQEAIPHLQRSSKAGFPEGRSAEGHRLLGEALFVNGFVDDAITHLKTAVQDDVTYRRELLPILAEAQAASALVVPREALTTLTQYFKEPNLHPIEMANAELLRIRLWLEQGRYEETSEAIKDLRGRVQPQVDAHQQWALDVQDQLALIGSEVAIALAENDIARRRNEGLASSGNDATSADIADSQPHELPQLDREIERLDALQRESPPDIALEARLLSARAFRLQKRYRSALSQLTTVRSQRPLGSQGFEGGLGEIELLAMFGQGPEVVSATRYLVRETKQSPNLSFSPAMQSRFTTILTESLLQLRRLEAFEHAVETARALSPIFGVAESSLQEARAFRDWGDATLANGRGAGQEISREAAALARRHYRQAGDAYKVAANERFTTDQYLPTLWSAIDAFQRGRDFAQSISLLKSYLQYEERGRQPRGLVAYGRALLAEGRPDEAMDALQTCIVEFERDPLRYDARLLAAQAAIDDDRVEQARLWLIDNLNDGELTPQSPTWRDSLFTLAEMLFQSSETKILEAEKQSPEVYAQTLVEVRDNLNESIRRLGEAVQRYDTTQRAQMAAYQLAHAHLLATRGPELTLNQEENVESIQRDLRRRVASHKAEALRRFETLVNFLSELARDEELSDRQTAILRNAMLDRADLLKELGRIAEAEAAYRALGVRFMNEPPALEALLGQSRMARTLGRQREADLLIRQASMVLDRIGPQWDSRFSEVTRYDRAGWRRYLDWMIQRLDASATRLTNTNANNP